MPFGGDEDSYCLVSLDWKTVKSDENAVLPEEKIAEILLKLEIDEDSVGSLTYHKTMAEQLSDEDREAAQKAL